MAADYKTLFAIVRELTDRLVFLEDAETSNGAELIKRARAALEPSKPKTDPKILHMQPFDECCSGPFRKAAAGGRMDQADEWSCPKCGCLWKATAVDGVRKWAPQPAAMTFKL